ncbi:hypothetical protein HGM15179_010281 [Zosterops borbonicus]|uniref:Uncharacterized protein n=1 Tax=Zosterops borbonicus TaxID=364589 RepID=A0A8K1GDN9_9PASS|nr:hypothetical protein HGM15179_010281 [Zosterops borbonicus]
MFGSKRAESAPIGEYDRLRNGARSWLSWEVPEDWRKVDIIPAAKKDDLENYRQVSLTSVLVQMMEKILPETLSKHMKDKKVIGSSHN